MSEPTPDRIATLDVIRGVAVMGILLANLPAFGLPGNAYLSPLPGAGTGDRIAWALNFVLIEGKLRGLFSFLFGASLLLVVERAEAAGESGAGIHYRRMFWLFVIGYLHLYLLWWGDILAHYALVGSVAFLFRRLSVEQLLAAGATATLVGWAPYLLEAPAAFGGGPGLVGFLSVFGGPDPGAAAELGAMRGGWWTGVRWRWEHARDPVSILPLVGPETLGAMLWGMAGLRSGLLTGAWERERYRRWAFVALAIGWTGYAGLAAGTMASGFDPSYVFLNSVVLAAPLRPLLIVGYACLVALMLRPGGRLTERIAAAGRAAFTNYLGTTVLMCFVFDGWGLGLFAMLGRAQMYALAPLAWALMLLWSKPWLDRCRYGPLEWLWRSLSRLEPQPMRLRPARTSS